MANLVINDLVERKELDGKAMAGVYGGEGLLDIFNAVADLDLIQAFNVTPVAANTSFVNAFQANKNGNGVQITPQFIFVDQDADANADNLGNTTAQLANFV